MLKKMNCDENEMKGWLVNVKIQTFQMDIFEAIDAFQKKKRRKIEKFEHLNSMCLI